MDKQALARRIEHINLVLLELRKNPRGVHARIEALEDERRFLLSQMRSEP